MSVLSVLPSFNACGGIERYSVNYFMHFSDRVHMDFVTHDRQDDVLTKQVKTKGSHVYVLPPFSGRSLLHTLRALERFFHENGAGYDAIHCNMANAACFYFPHAKAAGIKTRILHSHQDRAADLWSHALRNKPLLKAGVPMATDYWACSRQAGDFLFKKRPYKIIPNAIDAEHFRFDPQKRAAFRKEYQLGQSLVIGTIGRLTEQKNQTRLLDMMNILVHEWGIDAMLLIVGDGHLLDKLMQKSAMLSLDDRVIFTRSLADVVPALSAMDLFVLPSLYEGLGIVNIEAQANGLPVLVSDNVPDDANMGPLFSKLSLSASDAVWAKRLLEIMDPFNEKERLRKTHITAIEQHGYDLSTEALKLENYYLELQELTQGSESPSADF